MVPHRRGRSEYIPPDRKPTIVGSPGLASEGFGGFSSLPRGRLGINMVFIGFNRVFIGFNRVLVLF